MPQGNAVDTCTKRSGSRTPDSLPVTEAYEAYAPDLRRYATARTRDAATAEDIVQDAFVRLAVESQAWRTPRNPKAWLYRVVHNLIISRSRRADVARRRSSQLAFHDIVVESPEVLVLASERSRALGAALQAAGAAGRTSLVLAAQGYTGREIAELLGRSEGATRTIMCRARSLVRRELANHEAALVA
jgi:RNA polymerase sigma-70 factor (ECF subfamily)